jgi:translation elongation factor EF-G
MFNENLSYIDIIKKLQHKTENIRNVCVLAHVDHGNLKVNLKEKLVWLIR